MIRPGRVAKTPVEALLLEDRRRDLRGLHKARHRHGREARARHKITLSSSCANPPCSAPFSTRLISDDGSLSSTTGLPASGGIRGPALAVGAMAGNAVGEKERRPSARCVAGAAMA